MTTKQDGYLREIINRYESEEDEFVRELEQMQQSIREDRDQEEMRNTDSESDVQQDTQPILSVLCSLVDEIGNLRSENKRLKTRLALPQPRKNVVQRMSAILDARGISLPKLRKGQYAEVRIGARERLSTPPRKDPLTNSSISTDFSSDSVLRKDFPKKPPLVEAENSESDMDETAYEELSNFSPTSSRRARASERCPRDNSLSECTSPSSASSRDPSETMMSSRTSFLELIGLKKRREQVASVSELLHPSKAVVVKKRRKKSCNGETSNSGQYLNLLDPLCGNKDERQRQIKNRQSARFHTESEEERDEYENKRKSTSFLSMGSARLDGNTECMLRVDRETRLRHEKDTLSAEIEELKMRNTRLVEQLREKSSIFSRVHMQLQQTEEQVENLKRKCVLNDALDKLTLKEKLALGPSTLLEKVEECLRQFEAQLQAVKQQMSNNQHTELNSLWQERNSYRNCLEQVEQLQRENFRIIQTKLNESELDENLRRKLQMMPSYDALYSFTMGIVRKLSDLRSLLMEKTSEGNKAEMELIATQSSLLIAHAQIERLRLQLQLCGRQQRRPSSYHGEDYIGRMVKSEMNFLLPFKLHGSRVENMRRLGRKQVSSSTPDRHIEHEFLKLFGYAKCLSQVCDKAPQKTVSRIDSMLKEMNSPSSFLRHRQRLEGQTTRERDTQRRPISLVELEERRHRIAEEHRTPTRVSCVVQSPESIRRGSPGAVRGVVSSLQDVSVPALSSPTSTPLMMRRIAGVDRRPPSRNNVKFADSILEERRERRLIKQRSIDVELLRHSALRRQKSTEKAPSEWAEQREQREKKEQRDQREPRHEKSTDQRISERRPIERVLSDRLRREGVGTSRLHEKADYQRPEERVPTRLERLDMQRNEDKRQERAEQQTERAEERRYERVGGEMAQSDERPKRRIERRAPVQTRIRPPAAFFNKSRTMESGNQSTLVVTSAIPPAPSAASTRARTLDPSHHTASPYYSIPPRERVEVPGDSHSKLVKPEKRSWLEKLKMKK